MAGKGTKRGFEAAHRCLSVTISSFGDRPTRYLVTYRYNEKGDVKQVEGTIDRGEWATQAQTPDDHLRALAWLSRKLWEEMQARNG